MPFSKYSEKQKKLARVAEPRDAITGADFKALKKGNKMKKYKYGKEVKKMRSGGSCSKKYRYGGEVCGSANRRRQRQGAQVVS